MIDFINHVNGIIQKNRDDAYRLYGLSDGDIVYYKGRKATLIISLEFGIDNTPLGTSVDVLREVQSDE